MKSTECIVLICDELQNVIVVGKNTIHVYKLTDGWVKFRKCCEHSVGQAALMERETVSMFWLRHISSEVSEKLSCRKREAWRVQIAVVTVKIT